MFDVYCCGSPNVYKVTICLAEMGLEWRDIPIAVDRGEQHRPEFLAINGNGRVPVLVDHAPADGGPPETVWESGAILTYLAEKTGQFLPASGRMRTAVHTWLFWQMASQGPMSGQRAHFVQYEIPGQDYALDRYLTELQRLYTVLDRHLADREWIAGDYSIADIACFPWARSADRMLGVDLSGLANLNRWREAIRQRPAVIEAYRRMKTVITPPATREERFAAMVPAAGLAALG